MSHLTYPNESPEYRDARNRLLADLHKEVANTCLCNVMLNDGTALKIGRMYRSRLEERLNQRLQRGLHSSLRRPHHRGSSSLQYSVARHKALAEV